ncbi:MAG: hypothetical protein LC107_08230 [Chitinophagales bacterium]|nr:hypothetical protein [Chitinophagales bacterium]
MLKYCDTSSDTPDYYSGFDYDSKIWHEGYSIEKERKINRILEHAKEFSDNLNAAKKLLMYMIPFPMLNDSETFMIDIADFPGIYGYALPSQKDIVEGSEWYRCLYENDNNLDPEYLPYVIYNDYNQDSIMDVVCVLKPTVDTYGSLVCLYVSTGTNQYKVYVIDERDEFWVNRSFLFPLGKGDELCLYEGDDPREITARHEVKNEGFCLTYSESSRNIMVEYNPETDGFTFGFLCKE